MQGTKSSQFVQPHSLQLAPRILSQLEMRRLAMALGPQGITITEMIRSCPLTLLKSRLMRSCTGWGTKNNNVKNFQNYYSQALSVSCCYFLNSSKKKSVTRPRWAQSGVCLRKESSQRQRRYAVKHREPHSIQEGSKGEGRIQIELYDRSQTTK